MRPTLLRRRALCAVGALIPFLLPGQAVAQTRNALNPEISFIGDVRALAGDTVPGDLVFEFTELEIGATASLNPFANGSIFVGLHDGEIEVEEGFVAFTALPGGFGLRAGRFLVDQGRFAGQHSHTFSYLDMPLFVQEFFGQEGLGAVGINPTRLIGLGDTAVTISANALGGLAGHEHTDEEDVPEEEAHGEEPRYLHDLTYTGRVSAFVELGDISNLDVGVGGGTRVPDPDSGLRATWFGADFKYKWRPDARRSFSLVGELLQHRQEVAGTAGVSTEDAIGIFAAADLQVRRHWNFGALIDHTQLAEDADSDRTGVGIFAGYSLFEETTLVRFLVRRDAASGQDEETTYQLQLVSSMGPHKPHQF